ncbi:hypothetical protein BX616_008773 [Lobosporangium transversale]|uniref:Uncharacterized protein n=1 Tax=Lobosporangium transversale TaxID=64571 RepID=A0A1Y2GFT6_9FUNG|nr:hypothetical protein BCR41DRAFT_358244 [Lobosporangium transversale]KAF9918442.1 hypothetical protein BX616_008773 [Lobosporangium transversale]ORZ09662.1 hypothetical protein BCR41DRAFT_358244 [Lobosporangium transversale]|eukprot:XP_021878932.1 hypothetical protein BCR41DRAFT_358244 [Lobosporangium transversale]
MTILDRVRGPTGRSRISGSSASASTPVSISHSSSHQPSSVSLANSLRSSSKNVNSTINTPSTSNNISHSKNTLNSTSSTRASSVSAGALTEHGTHNRKYGSGISSNNKHACKATARIGKELYHEDGDIIGHRKEELRYSHHNGSAQSSSLTRYDAIVAERIAVQKRSEDESNTSRSSTDADTNFKTGIKLIQQAYEDKYQALLDEVSTWKWISEEQSVQMTVMATELAQVEKKYVTLQKEMAQLETFRKAIVSMVDQHSGATLTQLERSILETIEADAENGDLGYNAVANGDTSSFILDDNTEHLPRLTKEDQFIMGQKASNVPSAISSTFKSSSLMAASRPRASTESVVKRPSTMLHSRTTKYSTSSPLRQNRDTTAYHSGATTHPDNSSSDHKYITKQNLVDGLRSKRNTISTTSRRQHPGIASFSANTSRRHSGASPPSLLTKTALSSSRVTTTALASLSSISSSASSPPQTSSSTAASSIGGSINVRTARQKPQRREHSLDIRTSVAQVTNPLGDTPLLSTVQSERHQGISEGSLVLQSKLDTTDPSQVDTKQRSITSDPEKMFMRDLSPAAIELFRQQEEQQKLEIEADYASKKAVHVHIRYDSRQTDDEGYRRSASRSTSDRSDHLHYQRRYSGSGQITGHESSSKLQKSNFHATTTIHEDNSRRTDGIDANAFTTLYKEIRDSMDSTSFGMFARVVTAFNEGDKTTEETLEEVSRVVKDCSLNQRFQDLIYQAVAEKESQMANESTNLAMEANRTIDIDKSLLLDDEDVITEEEEGEEDVKNGLLADEIVNILRENDVVLQECRQHNLSKPEERIHLGETKILDVTKSLEGSDSNISNK